MAQSGTTDLGANIGGNGVLSLNGLTGMLTLLAGTGIAITSSGSTITITNTDSGGPGSFTPGSVIFAGADGALAQNNADFFWDNTNLALGIGVIPATTAVLDIVNSSGTTKAVQTTGYGSNVGFRGRRANGTITTPINSLAGDALSFFSGRGYGATGFAAVSTAAVTITALENFTDTAMGTSIAFNATQAGANTSSLVMTMFRTGTHSTLMFADGLNAFIQAGTSASNGQQLVLEGGTATTGNGGTTTVTGGSSAAIAGSSGGTLSLTGGAGSVTGSGGNGGAVNISAGDSGGDNTINRTGGAINISAGKASGSSTGGAIVSTAGAGGTGTGTAGATGGAITNTSGAGGIGSLTSGAGGATTLNSGAGGGGVAAGNGGGTTINSGVGGVGSTSSGNGGTTSITSGAGGASSVTTGGAGGSTTFGSGTGGVSTSGAGGAGGSSTISAGTGGNGTTAGGAGGTLQLNAGAAGTGGTGVGGTITFRTAATTTLTEKMRLTNAGLLGIGNANPTYMVDVVGGNIGIGTAGDGYRTREGSNAKQGVATLAAGTVTVANSSVTSTSRIFLTAQSLGTIAVPAAHAVTARTAGTSFTITSSAVTDTSVIAYEIFEPY